MITHRFLFDGGVPEMYLKACRRVEMPDEVDVYHAGRPIGKARREEAGYTCDIPAHLQYKLKAGDLDYVFVFEPPLTGPAKRTVRHRELVSILLVLKMASRFKA